MSEDMSPSSCRTWLWAVSSEQGDVAVHTVPEPSGDTVRTLGAAACPLEDPDPRKGTAPRTTPMASAAASRGEACPVMVNFRRSDIAPQPNGAGHPLDADGEGRLTERNTAVLLAESHSGVVSAVHGFGQFGVETLFGPAELLDILGPFEVRPGHPTGVGQDVGNHQHTEI